MDRRTISTAFLAASLLAAWPAARAQSARRPLVGYFSLLPLSDPPSPERAAFLAGLADEGLAPGRAVEIVYASAEGNVEFIDDVARDLVARKPDVIVSYGGLALQTLKRATRDVPVVMLAVGDPVGMGLVKSLGRPGGNFTGSSYISGDLAAKRVQLLHDVAPRARRMAITYDRRNQSARLESEATLAAARAAGLQPLVLPFDDDEALSDSLRKIEAGRAESLYVVFEGAVVARRRFEIAQFALDRRLPSIGSWAGLADAGCLMSYGSDLPAMFRRGAYYVARILRGAKAAELPVEQASRFEFVVNMKTASQLGVTIPPNVLLRATRIIE